MEKLNQICGGRPSRLDSQRQVCLDYKGNRTKREINVYPSNFITTSKYTLITFLPMSLLGQFARYANIYFLFIAIIQSIPIISPLSPISAIAPLVFVLGLSMIREGAEDFSRHRSDSETNAAECKVWRNGKIEKTTWAHINVGDLVYVEQDEMFSADLVVLGSSIESGACYIETSSLDGEKNLKPKSAIGETQGLFKDYQKLDINIEVFLDAGQPVQALHEYEGAIRIKNLNLNKSLNQKQLLLRGAFLRNTEWILAGVVYTGEDTKIMRNAEAGRTKVSQIEVLMNKLILGILFLQISLCVLSACLASYWLGTRGVNHKYIITGSTDIKLQSFLTFFSYFLLYNTMIPISLIVSMEFVKVFQVYFIEKDEDMFVAARQKYAKAQTSTINEELGMVEYIFSDKTGTLTCNQMEFKYCIIGDQLYGEESDQQNNLDKIITQQQQSEQKAPHKHSVFNFKDQTLTGILKDDPTKKEAANYPINYKIISGDGKQNIQFTLQKQLIKEYFTLLACAHECIAQPHEGDLIYQGPSPDEITLVDAAKNMGYTFIGASASSQKVKIQDKDTEFDLKYAFEFDSTRKRMSVIIRDRETNQYKLYIKGADNIIKGRLKKDVQPFLPYIDGKLSDFSRIGLRTLCMAMKILSEEEFKNFDHSFNALSSDPEREKKILELTDKLERDLYLLGATAVEDKLQPQVPETIADLLKANIKVWMLTGDKMETAENIARSCRLIQGDFEVLRFSEPDKKTLTNKIHQNRQLFDKYMKQHKKKSILVEGETLGMIITDRGFSREFVQIAKNCESVVCCRVTPRQKAQVVRLIKDSLGKVTLAIGDGANDVNMIQEAHIGIGLYGNEGMRAVQSSDFALGEFRCLWRLLLVHGHWSYIRISEMILYFFYKNMIFTVPQFFFAFYSAYSAQTYFDDWYITFYNLFFTALPLIFRATFDQDVNYKGKPHPDYPNEVNDFRQQKEDYLKTKFPTLYYIGQKKTIFTIPNFIFWAIQGFIHGVIVFFIALWSYNFEILNLSGMPAGFAAISITVYTSIIFIVDIKIALYTKFWTWFNFFGIILLSLGIYIIYFFLSNYWIGTMAQDTPIYLVQTPHFYLLILLLNCIVFIFDITVNQIIRELWPNQIDQMLEFRSKMRIIEHKEVEKYQKQKNRPNMQFQMFENQQKRKEFGLSRQWGDTFRDDQAYFYEQKAKDNSNGHDELQNIVIEAM